jgi:Fe-S-cluster-containing hydrogenase component 2
MSLKPIRIEASVCTGCRACEAACVLFHDDALGTSTARIHVLKDEAEGLDEPKVCRLCPDPSCVHSCPEGALKRDPRLGVITLDPNLCTSCGICAPSCPFGSVAIDPRDGRPLICDLCGGAPACVIRCSCGALQCESEGLSDPLPQHGQARLSGKEPGSKGQAS